MQRLSHVKHQRVRGQRQVILRGALWVASARTVVRLLGLGSTVVLARLLSPEDFGLVAVSMAIISFLRASTELSFAHALIHYQDATDTDYATAWTLNALRGLLIGLIALAAAYPAAILTGDDRVMPLVAVLAAHPLLQSLENSHFVRFEKALQFDALFWLMACTKVAGVVVAVSVAVIWHSYWALVAGMIATVCTRTILTFVMTPGPIWLTVRSWRRLLGFSGWLSGADVLGALGRRLDPLLLGFFASTQVVGFLHMARELTWMTFNEIAAPLRRVLFPALSRLQVGSNAFNSAYTSAVAGLFMVLAPVIAGLALTAPNAIPLLLGDKWDEVILPVQLLAASLIFSIPGRVAQSAVMASGHTLLIFQRTLLVLPIKLIAFLVGAYYYGLIGAVLGGIAAMFVETVVNILMARKVTGISAADHFRHLSRSCAALSIMAVAVISITYVLPSVAPAGQHFPTLVAQVSAGAVAYLTTHLGLWWLAGQPRGPEAVATELALNLAQRITRKTGRQRSDG